MKKREYIESPKHGREMYSNPSFKEKWNALDRVSIEKIKADKSLLASKMKLIIPMFLPCQVILIRNY